MGCSMIISPFFPLWAAGEQLSFSCPAEFLPFPKDAVSDAAPALLMSSVLSSISTSAGTGSVQHVTAPVSSHKDLLCSPSAAASTWAWTL